MSNYISYMGTDDIIADYVSVNNLEAEDVTVTGDIEVGGLVDGVDISTLAAEVKDLEAKSGNYVDLSSYQIITGNKVFDANLTYFSNPRDHSVVVDGGIKTRVLTTTSEGTSSFQGRAAFYQDIDVKQNIIMSDHGTVDGVDISELPGQISNVATDLGDLSDQVEDVEGRVDIIEGQISTISTDYVDKKTDQTITGIKTFVPITYFGPIYSNSGNIRSGSNDNSFAVLHGGTTSHSRGPAVDLISNIQNTRSELNFITNTASLSSDYSLYEDIDDKKLYIARGFPFTGGPTQPMMTLDGATNTITFNSTINGLGSFVTLDTDQTVVGKKIFTQPTIVRYFGGNGLITMGMGLRSGSTRAQQMIMSDGDSVAEIYFGSDVDGSGIADMNQKWAFSSRDSTNSRMIFYRCPYYAGVGVYDSVMDFHSESKESCVINMYKQVNARNGIRFGTGSGSTLNYYQEDSALTATWTVGWSPHRQSTIKFVRVGSSVTLTLLSLSELAVGGPTSGVTATNAIPARYRPAVNKQLVAWNSINGVHTLVRCEITASGNITFFNPSMVMITGNWGWFNIDLSYSLL